MYGSEAYFFKNIRESRFLTTDPLQAHLFFIPLYWHKMRSQGNTYENMAIVVENYVQSLISKYPYWNQTQGVDHFFVTCHDIGVEVPIRLVCPAGGNAMVNRKKSGLWAHIPNSEIRASLQRLWKDDSEVDIQNNLMDTAEGCLLYHDKVLGTKFCVCPHGFPANTAFIADSIRYGCVPVIFTNHLDFPFNVVLDWKKNSIMRDEDELYWSKDILRDMQDANFTGL